MRRSWDDKLSYAVFRADRFWDIQGHWAEALITDMAGRFIVSGAGSDEFQPNSPIVRAEFAKMAAKALSISPSENDPAFPDVPKGVWYSGYIAAAQERGLLKGYADGAMRPENTITREEAVTIAARALGGAGDGPLENYADCGAVGAWARDSFAVCISRGVVRGYGDGFLRPQAEITRAEAAALLFNLEN
jgi:hypothetical protein